jgi:methylenetetrahydrofolate reductase (NADPH)
MTNNIKFSFEFFPPKTRSMGIALSKAIKKLSVLEPEFVSVTYGAAGTTRTRTHRIIKNILNNTSLTPVPHLTCIGSSKDEITKIAKKYLNMGVKNILALRGDLPQGYQHPKDGYDFAWKLVAALKEIANFNIIVAGYPEKHPEAKSLQEDMDNIKRKIDNGASHIITQFFFDNNKFYDYLNLLQRNRINVPVTPGILPIVNFAQTVKFAKACNTHIPKEYYKIFSQNLTDIQVKNLVATHLCVKQCEELSQYGIDNFHFYSLNRADLILAICHILINNDSLPLKKNK